jgi:hypothetical protein
MTDPVTGTAAYTDTDADTVNQSAIHPTITTTDQPRRLLRFIKNEPGHRVSVTVNIIFLLNGILFAVFAVMSLLMPSGTPDEHFDVMDVFGVFLFCMWNSIVFNLIILFPSITTVNREKVPKWKVEFLLLLTFYLFICLEFDFLLFKWFFNNFITIIRFFPSPHPFPNFCFNSNSLFCVSPFHGHLFRPL